MNIKIPLCIDGERRTINASIEASVFAELKWESEFPKLAEKESIIGYSDRISKEMKKNGADISTILSALKAFYCFLDGDELPNFKDFTKQFSAEHSQHTQNLTDILIGHLAKIVNSSAGNLKN